MLVVCERWVGDGNRPLHIDPSCSDHSRTSSSSWLGCSTMGHWGPKALRLPLALNSASCPQLTPTLTDSSRLCPGYIFVWRLPASAVLLLIYTGASLDWQLSRGSICYTIFIFLARVWILFCIITFHAKLTPFCGISQGNEKFFGDVHFSRWYQHQWTILKLFCFINSQFVTSVMLNIKINKWILVSFKSPSSSMQTSYIFNIFIFIQCLCHDKESIWPFERQRKINLEMLSSSEFTDITLIHVRGPRYYFNPSLMA